MGKTIKTHKRCCVCKKEKPVSDFYKNRSALDGYAYRCKMCDDEACRLRYEQNWEKVQQYKKDWYEKNRERILKKAAEWRELNRDKKREINRKYVRGKHAEKL